MRVFIILILIVHFYCESVLKINTKTEVYLNKSILYPNDYMAQQDYFQNKVNEAPENKLFRFSLAKILFDKTLFLEAIPHLRKCVELENNWMLARILLGKAYLQTGQYNEAKASLTKALDLAIEQKHEDPKTEILKLLDDLSH